MKIVFTFLAVVVAYVVFVLSGQSDLEDHSLFLFQEDGLYETLAQDRSFGKNVEITLILDKIDFLKKRIKTGEYQIKYKESLFSVLKKILNGECVIRKVTIPEGYTVQMIVEKLSNIPFLKDEIVNIPEEGSLFPSTYVYKFNDSRNDIIKLMQKHMSKIVKQYEAQNKTNLSMKQVVILASIIEKEAGNDSERKLISSVFHNRLAKNMRLQSDPTVIYAMSDGYGKIDRKLTRKDLWFVSPFNTYRNKGLPPTPICCPGKKSIEAAIYPEQTDFFYFVKSKNNNFHEFSKNFNEHRSNIKKNKADK